MERRHWSEFFVPIAYFASDESCHTKDGWFTVSEKIKGNHTGIIPFFPVMRGKRNGVYIECLELIHDHIFSKLETAMIGVAEALTAFAEICK